MFTVRLSAASNDPVTVGFATTNGTAVAGSDFEATSGTLTFLPNESLTQTVSVSTINDSSTETDENMGIVLFSPVGVALGDSEAVGTITDNDAGPATKFYVVNDGGSDNTFEYAADGSAVESQPIDNSNSAPRGIATSPAGDRSWVVDANLNVYVYDTSGNALGSWYASSIGTKSQLQGIATDGSDIWLVDDKFNMVHRFADATSFNSGNHSPTSSFELTTGNKKPRGIVTDGDYIWVVNDAKNDKVFKYTVDGTFVGSWKLNTSGASSPTGIAIDPTGDSQSIWIVDSGTDRVYEYSNARDKTGGKKAASDSFALAAGNDNPQGIADPPPTVSFVVPASQIDAVFASDEEFRPADEDLLLLLSNLF